MGFRSPGNRDGHLYYANRNVEIMRLASDGKLALVATNLQDITEKLGGIKRLVSGSDGSLFVGCPSAVLKVQLDGTVSTLVHPIALKECDKDLPAEIAEPGLRGLAESERGQFVEELEILAKAGVPADFTNLVRYLPTSMKRIVRLELRITGDEFGFLLLRLIHGPISNCEAFAESCNHYPTVSQRPVRGLRLVEDDTAASGS